MKNFVIVAIVLVLVIGGIIWWQKRPVEVPADNVVPVATTTEDATATSGDAVGASVDASVEAVVE